MSSQGRSFDDASYYCAEQMKAHSAYFSILTEKLDQIREQLEYNCKHIEDADELTTSNDLALDDFFYAEGEKAAYALFLLRNEANQVELLSCLRKSEYHINIEYNQATHKVRQELRESDRGLYDRYLALSKIEAEMIRAYLFAYAFEIATDFIKRHHDEYHEPIGFVEAMYTHIAKIEENVQASLK